MNVRKMTRAAVLGAATASLVLTGVMSATAASADDNNTGVNIPILSDNLIHLPVNIPVNVCGNSINILGLTPLSGSTSCDNSRPMASRPTPMPPVTTPPVTVPPVTPPPVTVPPETLPPVTTPPVTVPGVTVPPVTVRPGEEPGTPEVPVEL